MGLLSGLTPDLTTRVPEQIFNSSAQAQSISASQVRNYANSVLQIEPHRQTAYEEIKRIGGNGNVPTIACHRPNSLNNLNRNIREIAVTYCNRAIAIVESNNLTIVQFNTITTAQQSDADLQSRIREELVRLQQANSSN